MSVCVDTINNNSIIHRRLLFYFMFGSVVCYRKKIAIVD